MLEWLRDIGVSALGWIVVAALALLVPGLDGVPRIELVRIISDMVGRFMG